MSETWRTVRQQASREAGECPFLLTVGFSLVQAALWAGVSSREVAWLLLPGSRSCLREALYILFYWFTLQQGICSGLGPPGAMFLCLFTVLIHSPHEGMVQSPGNCRVIAHSSGFPILPSIWFFFWDWKVKCFKERFFSSHCHIFRFFQYKLLMFSKI